jgi:hypothetical protein
MRLPVVNVHQHDCGSPGRIALCACDARNDR